MFTASFSRRGHRYSGPFFFRYSFTSFFLEWDWKWKDDDSGPAAFERLGITGIHYPKYDTSLCSDCTFLNNYMLILLMGAYRGKPFPGLEFLGGKNARSREGFSKTFLFGRCAIREKPVLEALKKCK